MKSRVDMLQVLQGILMDASVCFPTEQLSFERDFKRIALSFENRSYEVFLRDLPSLDNVLLQGLACGRLIPYGPLTRTRRGSKCPIFLSGLWLRVFDSLGVLCSDPDPNAVFFIRQLSNIGKKLDLPCSSSIVKETINEYFTTDNELPSPTLAWNSDSLGPNLDFDNSIHVCDRLVTHRDDYDGSQLSLFEGDDDSIGTEGDELLLRNYQSTADEFFTEFFSTFDISSQFETEYADDKARLGFRHGPGAVANGPSTFDKFSFPYWSDKLQKCFPSDLVVGSTPTLYSDRINHELPSRLICVPKDARGPRLIAAEPVEHQYVQQFIYSFIKKRLKELYGNLYIDFTRQDLSQRLAKYASKHGSLSTIDLKSASDRLSCWLIERSFRKSPKILDALHSSRTRWIKYSDRHNTIHAFLRKFASQGCATTFPIQSLIFFCICLSTSRGHTLQEKLINSRRSIRVFGDDLIIPSSNAKDTIRLLELLHLKVNVNKSFTTGYFRESCGGDYFMNYDVTPTKLRHIDTASPTKQMALLDISNNLFQKGLWHTSKVLEKYIRNIEKYPIVSSVSGDIGIKSYVGGLSRHLTMRWNSRLHIVEYHTLCFSNKVDEIDRCGISKLRSNFLSKPWLNESYSSNILGMSSTKIRRGWRPLELTSFKGIGAG